MTPWTTACQAPLSMEFSRQEYWSWLSFPSPGESSQSRDQTHVPSDSCVGRRILYHWATLFFTTCVIWSKSLSKHQQPPLQKQGFDEMTRVNFLAEFPAHRKCCCFSIEFQWAYLGVSIEIEGNNTVVANPLYIVCNLRVTGSNNLPSYNSYSECHVPSRVKVSGRTTHLYSHMSRRLLLFPLWLLGVRLFHCPKAESCLGTCHQSPYSFP